MSIPKRPEPQNPEGGVFHNWERYNLERYVHEHAVAVRAVEALRVTAGAMGICDETKKPICSFCGYVEHPEWCQVGSALRDIEESGWKPPPKGTPDAEGAGS